MAVKPSDRLSTIAGHVKEYARKDRKPATVDRFTGIDEQILSLINEQKKTNLLLERILSQRPAEQKIPEIVIPQNFANNAIIERLDKLIGVTEIRGSGQTGQDFYFTYPSDGTTKTVGAGRTIIDFYNGTVKLPDGTKDNLSDSLAKRKLPIGSIRSFTISSNQAAKYSLDSGGMKPITATDFQSDRNESFTILVLETTVDTQITVWASTNPDAFFGKLGAGTTGGIVNSYGMQVDPLAETGTPGCDLGYYSQNSLTYTTLASKQISSGKYGVLHEVSMTPDPKALYKLTIGGVVQFTDKKIVSPLAITFPPNKLAALTTVLLEVKSSDGTNLNVNGEIALKEITIT